MLNAEVAESKRRRDASRLEQARTRCNDCFPLLRLGRLMEARALLLGCRRVLEDEHDLAALGNLLSALADVEDALGHADNAVRLERDALRLSYVASGPDGIAASHFNLANYLQRAGQGKTMLAHRLACAVIEFQTGSGGLTMTLHVLAQDLAAFKGSPPRSFAELGRLVDQTDGVHLAQLIDRLPKHAPDGDKALAEVLRLARQLPA